MLRIGWSFGFAEILWLRHSFNECSSTCAVSGPATCVSKARLAANVDAETC